MAISKVDSRDRNITGSIAAARPHRRVRNNPKYDMHSAACIKSGKK